MHQRRRFINDFGTSGNFTIKPEIIATASSYIEGAVNSRKPVLKERLSTCRRQFMLNICC